MAIWLFGLAAIGLRLMGLLFLALAFGLFVASAAGSFGFFERLACAAGGGLSGVIGLVLVRSGKEFQAAASRENAVRDPRPPVIYLRSFAADAETAKGTKPSLPFLQETIETEEEQLAKAIGGIGPLVAIGNPGESLPTLGASRIYVADDNWQSAVVQYMNSASLLLIRVGATHGLLWEVAQAVRSVEPRRLVLLIPSVKSEYDTFVKATQRFFPCALPEYPEEDISSSKLGSLRGLIYFTKDWHARTVNLGRIEKPSTFNGSLTGLFVLALKPVFAQIGIPYKPHGLWKFKLLVAFIVFSIVLLLTMFTIVLWRGKL
jgi:hypothetical protein